MTRQKAVVTIEEGDEGEISVVTEFTPRITREDVIEGRACMAHQVGLACVQFIHELTGNSKVTSIREE
jgi:hypothetical protein